MMTSLKDSQKDIDHIKARNKRVELDKAWETSWMRRLTLLVFTYITVVVFFFVADLADPFVNAAVPSLAFIISTSTVSFIKRWWIKRV
jgi:hypothetical protein